MSRAPVYVRMPDQSSEDFSDDEDATSWTDATQTQDPEEQLEELRQKLRLAKDAERDRATELRRVEEFWDARKDVLKRQLQDKRREVSDAEAAVDELDHRIQHGSEPPPGPKCLRFVEGSIFPVVVSSVIVCNVITMTLCVLHPEYQVEFQVFDRLCLLFYIVELALRASFWQKRFLIGACRLVWWHWLDIFLIIDGVLFYCLPAQSDTRWIGYLRAVRILRYLRIVKLCHTVLQTNLSWTEGDRFQSTIMVIIFLNAIVMGLEAEYPQRPFSFIWVCFEHSFLMTFTFELAVRLKHQGWTFFTNPADKYWNWLDFIIVIGGIIDQWLLPILAVFQASLRIDDSSGQGGPMSDVLKLVRIARLLRILRLMRLVRNIPPLYTLMVGIVKAMQGMSWVMLLTVTVLYISALLGVKLVGPCGLLISCSEAEISEDTTSVPARSLHRGGGGSNNGESSHEVSSCFPNMFDAIFNMFKVMQMDLEPMEPLFQWSAISKYIIMFYVVVTNWAIFSILTAVVSDEMAKVTEKLATEVADTVKKKNDNKLVENIFDRIAKNKSEITKKDFMKLLENEHETQELCDVAELEPDDLKEFVDILSHENEDGTELRISRQEFLDGLQKERDAVNTRAMMKLEKRLDDIDERIYTGISSLEDLVRRSVGITPRPLATPNPSPSAGRGFGIASPRSSLTPNMQLNALGATGAPNRFRPR